MLREDNCQPRSVYPSKLSSKNEDAINMFSD